MAAKPQNKKTDKVDLTKSEEAMDTLKKSMQDALNGRSANAKGRGKNQDPAAAYRFVPVPGTNYLKKVPVKPAPVGKMKLSKEQLSQIREMRKSMKKQARIAAAKGYKFVPIPGTTYQKKIRTGTAERPTLEGKSLEEQVRMAQENPEQMAELLKERMESLKKSLNEREKNSEVMIPVAGTSYVQPASSLRDGYRQVLYNAMKSNAFGSDGKYNGPMQKEVKKAMLNLSMLSLLEAEQTAIKNGKCGPDKAWKPTITPLMENGKQASIASFLKYSPTARKVFLSPDIKSMNTFLRDPDARTRISAACFKEASRNYKLSKSAAPAQNKQAKKVQEKGSVNMQKG